MNIFVLHTNPAIAAQMLCDKHVSKMILETALMLSTVAVSLGHENPCLYKPVHRKHPCTLWAGESYWNWKWLCVHGLSMADEFEYRYNNRHKSGEVIRFIYDNKLGPTNRQWHKIWQRKTPYAQAMPQEYKNKDAVVAYRNYYLGEKERFAKWTRRTPPEWWKDTA